VPVVRAADLIGLVVGEQDGVDVEGVQLEGNSVEVRSSRASMQTCAPCVRASRRAPSGGG
jgi:hypothetical protein